MNDRAPIRDRTLVLRVLVPGLEARLRDKMKDMEDAAACTATGANAKDLYLDLEGVSCEPTAARNGTLWNFHCDGATYPAKLVNLPCPVELHKTHDHAIYIKSVDIAQMLIVYEDDMALEEAEEKPPEGFNYYHSGLTPPTRRIVERRFAAREHKAMPPPRSASAYVETELLELMEKLTRDDKGKRNKATKVPTLTSATKVLEEVEEEVVDYEPWMSDYGKQPHGIEFDTDSQLCSLHPEIWLKPSVIQEMKEAEDEERRMKEELTNKKAAKRKEKKQQGALKKAIAEDNSSEMVDEVTQAAASMLSSDGFDLMDDDALFDLDLDGDDGMDFGNLDL
ncbi:hypothetical protein FisN_20Lh253 [Fistulifera solaris]|uniref:TAFII55 protein conserved region domain-containing protein n=1 Tax=Fistulifera solaris TaxID=1519565 RepID=A0A1Z5KS62_FISSO|nr:hypothetical protein FisN_20Lh253 [Fistulifera solaris]|eukprot:GAX28932.1 hypothetical protein FisN_20Lh253 [Fistulifera solaris]